MGRIAGLGVSVAAVVLAGSSAVGASQVVGGVPETTTTSTSAVVSTTTAESPTTGTTIAPEPTTTQAPTATTTTQAPTATTITPAPTVTTITPAPTATSGAEPTSGDQSSASWPTTTTAPPPGCLVQPAGGLIEGTFGGVGPFDDEVPLTGEGTGQLQYLGASRFHFDLVGRTAGTALDVSGTGTVTSEAGDLMRLRVVGTADTTTGLFALQLTVVGGTGPIAGMRGTVVARGNVTAGMNSAGMAGALQGSIDGALLYGPRCSVLGLPRTGGGPAGAALAGALTTAAGLALVAGGRRRRHG